MKFIEIIIRVYICAYIYKIQYNKERIDILHNFRII